MNCSCKTWLFSDAFCLTKVDFFRDFYKHTLNTCILTMLIVILMATNHKGFAGFIKGNKQSGKIFLHSVRKFMGPQFKLVQHNS